MMQQARARVAAAGAPAMAARKLFSSSSSSSPTSSSYESSLEEAEARTPLATVAEAFEELARMLGGAAAGGRQGSELRLRPFSDACSLVSVLFGCLGFAFKFAEMEYVAKVHDLLEASKTYETLTSMLEKDVECDTVKKPGSHSRNLRRVRQGLDLIKALFEQFLSSNDYSLREAASTAYEKVCAPYHTWAIRTAVGAGMYALPTREQLVCRLNETHHSVRTGMQRYIDASSPIIQYIDTLYVSRNITLDW
ncbi:hypothetical protein Taro_022239 [Colocasia esculenta]|uniref:Glycolipid transfer protein domain-containing protein n=1 Tax=Colocasia esculenta TaxID=4460 RepID=A0A843V0X8_COLES|nr:hypothetical protein [Colocasia esculenta]